MIIVARLKQQVAVLSSQLPARCQQSHSVLIELELPHLHLHLLLHLLYLLLLLSLKEDMHIAL
jgi:hypothetical protein